MAMTHIGILLGAISTERERTEVKLRQAYRKVQTFNHNLERQVRDRPRQHQAQCQCPNPNSLIGFVVCL